MYIGIHGVILTENATCDGYLVLHSCAICPALPPSILTRRSNGGGFLGFYHLITFSRPTSSEFCVTVNPRLLATLQWQIDLLRVTVWQSLLLHLALVRMLGPEKESIISYSNTNSFFYFYVEEIVLAETDRLSPLSSLGQEYLTTMGTVPLQDSEGKLINPKDS